MKVMTKEILFDRIAQERIWRIKEIDELRKLIATRTTPFEKKKVLCRSGVVLLYAHWEGFVKKIGTLFLEYVASRRLSLGELRTNFIAIITKHKIGQLTESNKYSSFGDIVTYLTQVATYDHHQNPSKR